MNKDVKELLKQLEDYYIHDTDNWGNIEFVCHKDERKKELDNNWSVFKDEVKSDAYNQNEISLEEYIKEKREEHDEEFLSTDLREHVETNMSLGYDDDFEEIVAFLNDIDLKSDMFEKFLKQSDELYKVNFDEGIKTFKQFIKETEIKRNWTVEKVDDGRFGGEYKVYKNGKQFMPDKGGGTFNEANFIFGQINYDVKTKEIPNYIYRMIEKDNETY